MTKPAPDTTADRPVTHTTDPETGELRRVGGRDPHQQAYGLTSITAVPTLNQVRSAVAAGLIAHLDAHPNSEREQVKRAVAYLAGAHDALTAAGYDDGWGGSPIAGLLLQVVKPGGLDAIRSKLSRDPDAAP